MKKTKSLVVPFLVISLISCNKICKKMPTLSIHKTQFGKTIINNPEEYFTEEVMKQLDDAAEKEFRYGNIHSEV